MTAQLLRSSRRHRLIALLLLAIVGTMSCIIFPIPSAASANGEARPVVGGLAPDFTLEDMDGSPVVLSSFRGRVVIVNFWSIWCGPCVDEMPSLEAFHSEYGAQVTVLAVNVGDRPERVRRFAEQGNYTLRFVLDADGAVMDAYRAFGMPVSFFIDGNGIIQVRHMGPLNSQYFQVYMEQMGVEPGGVQKEEVQKEEGSKE